MLLLTVNTVNCLLSDNSQYEDLEYCYWLVATDSKFDFNQQQIQADTISWSCGLWGEKEEAVFYLRGEYSIRLNGSPTFPLFPDGFDCLKEACV